MRGCYIGNRAITETREHPRLQPLNDVIGVVLRPMIFVQFMPFTGNQLKSHRSVNGRSEFIVFFNLCRVIPCQKHLSGLFALIPRLLQRKQRIRAVRERVFFSTETVSLPPDFCARRLQVKIEAAPVRQLIRVAFAVFGVLASCIGQQHGVGTPPSETRPYPQIYPHGGGMSENDVEQYNTKKPRKHLVFRCFLEPYGTMRN